MSANLNNFLDSLQLIYNNKKSLQNRYINETLWLQDRREKWTSNKIRVGVVGVTSSGKSTLINAILGESLLSTAVKPTSSQIVTCSHGEKKACIKFENREDITLYDTDVNIENIIRYSDENLNTENKEHVKEIQLSLPTFDFGEEVLLIDSPGLDAYNLESHEKLTLEVLIPTIDICILVTTLKSNSDLKIKNILNIIAEYNRPLVIVQNMLDSVEPSVDGKKTKNMVANEHRNRVQKIIDESKIVDKDSVQIVQISAIQATNARNNNQVLEDSGYNNLKSMILTKVKNFLPNVENERLVSIIQRTKEIVSLENNNIKIDKNPVATIFEFEELSNEVESTISTSLEKLQQKLNIFNKYILPFKNNTDSDNNDFLTKAINFLSFFQGNKNTKSPLKNISDENDVKKILKELEIEIKDAENCMLETIKNVNKYITNVCKRIEIPSRDITVAYDFNSLKSSPKILTKQQTRYYEVEIDTFKGKIQRFIDWGNKGWGYETKSTTVTVFDASRTIIEIEKYIKKVINIYSKTIDNWMGEITNQKAKIKNEIDSRYATFRKLQEEIIEKQDVIWCINELELLLDKTNIKTFDYIKEDIISTRRKSELLHEIEITSFQKKLYNLTRAILYNTFDLILKKAQSMINAPEKSIILGWDEFSIESFILRYFNPLFTDKSQSTSFSRNPTVFCKPTTNNVRDKLNNSNNYSIYIMINAQQDGEIKKRIHELNLNEYIKTHDKIFFVIEDFNALARSFSITEMKHNVSEYYKEFNFPIDNKGFILINSENPLYSMAYIDYQIAPCNTITEEQFTIGEYAKNYGFFIKSINREILAELLRK